MASYSKSLEEWKRFQDLYKNEYKTKLSDIEAAGVQTGLSKEFICVLSFPIGEYDFEKLNAYLSAFNAKYRDKQYTPLVKTLYDTCLSLDVMKTTYQKGWERYLNLQEYLSKVKEEQVQNRTANNTPNPSIIYPN